MPEIAVTAEDVSAGKPDPEGFVRGARLLEVDPADCVVFEDSHAGIEAARRAGMPVVAVGARASGADWVVADLRGVTVRAVGDRVEIVLPD